MKGIYQTKEGSKVEVLDFDEANKIAMIKVNDSQNKWVDEKEYSTWEKEEMEVPEEDLGESVLEYQEEEAQEPVEEVAEEAEEQPAEETTGETTEEKSVRKRTYKKKEK